MVQTSLVAACHLFPPWLERAVKKLHISSESSKKRNFPFSRLFTKFRQFKHGVKNG